VSTFSIQPENGRILAEHRWQCQYFFMFSHDRHAMPCGSCLHG